MDSRFKIDPRAAKELRDVKGFATCSSLAALTGDAAFATVSDPKAELLVGPIGVVIQDWLQRMYPERIDYPSDRQARRIAQEIKRTDWAHVILNGPHTSLATCASSLNAFLLDRQAQGLETAQANSRQNGALGGRPRKPTLP